MASNHNLVSLPESLVSLMAICVPGDPSSTPIPRYSSDSESEGGDSVVSMLFSKGKGKRAKCNLNLFATPPPISTTHGAVHGNGDTQCV